MKNKQHIQRTFFKQQYHHDCGEACIKTVLSYFGLSTCNLPQLIEETTGIHLLAIKNQLQACGIAVKAFQCDPLNWSAVETISLMVTTTPSGSHAVILYPTRDKYHHKNRYLVGNPATGLSWVSLQDINWNGTLLTFDFKQHQIDQVKPLKLILKHQWLVFRENALFFNIIIFWGLLIILLTLAVPLIFQNGLDQFKLGQQIDQLIPIVLLVFFILFLRTGIVYLRQQLLSNFSKTYYHHSFKCWFKDLLKNNVKFWNTLNQGDFNQLLKEQHQLQQLNLLSITEIFNDLMLLVF
ncbi:MAG: hypothetical protein H7141_07105, partial [Burkholderiales bacterium]|nr:hypothetical protein [Bacteroidia bacterium]